MDPVIPADQLGPKVLEEVFKSMSPTNRGIAIGIANETSHQWNAMNTYFYSGSLGPNVLPKFVKSQKAILYKATKPSGLPSGSAGVITFFIPDDNMTVAVMFSVPFSRPIYRNWWNAKVYRNKEVPDYGMWSCMYNQEPFEGDNGWHEKELGEGYHVQGYMTSSSRCKLQLKIWKEADKDMPSQMYSQEPFEGDNGWHEEEIGEGYHVEGIMTSSSRCNCCFERQRLIRLIERVAPSFRHRKIVPFSLPKAN